MFNKDISVLFVCMGNICRSPTAEGVFRAIYQKSYSQLNIVIDSAGTIGYHQGESPDPRSVKAAKNRGYDLTSIRSRKVTPQDFKQFDYILAMDSDNVANLINQAQQEGMEEQIKKIQLFLDFATAFKQTQVPDPYYGGNNGFELVLDMIEDASKGFLEELKTKN